MDIIFRADGDSKIGLGHLMRSAALMQVLQPHFNCSLLTKNPEFFPASEFNIQPTIRQFSSTTIAEEAFKLASQSDQRSVVVLDGYQFNTEYQTSLKEAGLKLVYIDDLVKGHYVADAVINHAGGIDVSEYSCEEYTRLYLGPQYALVKTVFYEQAKPLRNINNKKFLLSLGGADPNNDTDKILGQLQNFSPSEINVVLGSANKHVAALKEKYDGEELIKFYSGLTSNALCRLMQECTYAVLSPSTICYEYMTVGGIVYLYRIADNQKKIQNFFLKEKMAFPFEKITTVSDEEKISSLEKQTKVFDGKSAERLVKIFHEL